MSLANAITNVTNVHKSTAKTLIYSSQKTLYINVVASGIIASSGASMFADLDDSDSSVSEGPFYCLWEDADSARLNGGSREVGFISKYNTADVIAKLWLEDILLDTSKTYGENYFDRCINVTVDDLKYDVLGYDRYGLGTTDPYVIAVALKGSFGYE